MSTQDFNKRFPPIPNEIANALLRDGEIDKMIWGIVQHERGYDAHWLYPHGYKLKESIWDYLTHEQLPYIWGPFRLLASSSSAVSGAGTFTGTSLEYAVKLRTNAIGPTTFATGFKPRLNGNPLSDGEYGGHISMFSKYSGSPVGFETVFLLSVSGGTLTTNSSQYGILVINPACEIAAGINGTDELTAIITAPTAAPLVWRVSVRIEGVGA